MSNMPKKDKNDSLVYRYLLNLNYEKTWDDHSVNENINKVLVNASKNGKGNPGFPDQFYVNEDKKFLIIVEVKSSMSEHVSKDGISEPVKYAVDGLLWYLSFFLSKNILDIKTNEYFKDWKIIGIAISGNISDEYSHRISTYAIIDDNIIEYRNIKSILNETDYLHLFENYDEEAIIANISSSSKKINKWLRSVDSQKRPVLLSALMICLFEIKDGGNSFITEYNSNSPREIVNKIQDRVDAVLAAEEVPPDKRNVLRAEIEFIHHDHDLNNSNVLIDILNELRDTVIPLFNRRSNYDIIGKFYEEFLRYAGVANVKKGIVLTPHHITTLFTELVDIRSNDVIFDACCGTGAFLIAGMNKLIEVINNSSLANKDKIIKNLKKRQLVGFEKNSTMYSLAISNMLFRGDGKSQIFNCDFFSREADEELQRLRNHRDENGNADPIIPSIGFINPPYGGKDNRDNPTKKEIQFITRTLDIVTRYVVVIAPLSTYFKDNDIRNNILQQHTLKFVINMPKDLFMPNAATNTAIAVFETNKPQGNQDVVLYDLIDDGFELSKAKGRTDVYSKWNKIKEDMLEKLFNPIMYEDKITLVKTELQDDDEWILQAHSKTDYSKLDENSFINTIKEYMIFTAKKEMGILDKNIDEVTLLDLLSNYYSSDNEEGM
jgi:type I restriction-modification system DNA methylase subunit